MKKHLALVFSLLFFAIGSTFAADADKKERKDGFKFSVDFTNMSVRGADVHVGDVYHYREDVTYSSDEFGTNDAFDFKYGMTYNPIITRAKPGFVPVYRVSFRKGKWAVGGSGWLFKTSDSKSGRVESLGVVRESHVLGNYVIDLRGGRFWDFTLFPTTDQREKGGFSPVTWFARGSLSHLSLDFFVSRELLSSQSVTFDVTAGLKVVNFKNEREEGLGMGAFVVWPWAGDNSDITFINKIDLRSKSNVNGTFWGPSLGLDSTFGVAGIKVSAGLKQAFVTRRANLSGNWRDVDDIVVIYRIGDDTARRDIFFDGNFPYKERQKTVVSVTDIVFRGERKVFKNISAGAGFSMSHYRDMPMAPSWSVPGFWSAFGGTHWEQNKINPTFIGFSGTVSINF